MTNADHSWLLDAVADPANGWAFGTFGAIAEFTRDPDEPTAAYRAEGEAEAATDRGAIRLALSPDLRPVAYETPNRDGETWSHAVALCLPAETAAMNRRSALTELGPDRDAIRPDDRDAVLFDMGLGTLPVDICVRTRDPGLLATLRSVAGRSLFEPGNPAMGAIVAAGPHRVFVGRVGRGEVYQPIPPADGRSPDGPHTHVLPKLLRTGRTHAATTPVPEGWVPAAHLFPPNPVKDAIGRAKPFDPTAQAAFAALLAAHGDPAAEEARRAVTAAIEAGHDPAAYAEPAGKHGRAALRVTLRKLRAAGRGGDALQAWRAAFDRATQEANAEDDEQPAHEAA